MTVRLSWSGLRVHEECKQRSHLARTHKLGTLDNKRNFLPGSVTDRVVRDWLNNDPLDHIGEMPSMVDATIESEKEELVSKGEGVVRWRNPGDRKLVVADCTEAVKAIEPILLKYVVPFDFEADKHFEAEIMIRHPRTGEPEQIILNGYMDILVRDDKGRWIVWDVKHTRDESYWRKTVGQLGFYDLAVELMFGQASAMTGLLQPLCKEKVKAYKPSVDSRNQLLQRILGMANDVLLDIKTPVEGTGPCGFCPTRHACTKFEPIIDAKGKKRMAL